jgi:hypothetical protein
MASTYSTNLKIELQATGENSGTWGTITNTNLGTALEQAIVGYGNPNYASDANLTLTYTDTNAAQAARALVLNVTSTGSLSTTRELIVPTIQKQYIVQNNTTGSQSITVKTSGGTGITVPNGRKAHLYVDGTNVIYMDDYVDINGGAIDGTPVGANSASTGAFTTLTASTSTTLDGGVVVNEPGADVDFRVESDTDANCLFVDASANAVGVGTASPGSKLDVKGTLRLSGSSSGYVGIAPAAAAGSTTYTLPSSDGTTGQVLSTNGSGTLSWASGASGDVTGAASSTDNALARFDGTTGKVIQNSNATLTDNGALTVDQGAVINESGADSDTRIEGDTDTNLVFVDASTDRVGVGTNTPSVKLDVNGSIKDGAGNVRAVPLSGSEKTASYTFATTDTGEYIQIGTGGDIVIPDATFAAGDIISMFNNTTGNITITCSITTAYIAGTDSDKATMTLATRGVATVLFISSTVCVVTGNVS